MTQSLNLLSQLSVEQFAIFSAENYFVCKKKGEQFDIDSIRWAVLAGILFAVIIGLIAPWLIKLFSIGFSVAEQTQALNAFYPMLLQVLATPTLFVIKQQMMISDRKLIATAMSWVTNGIQFIILVVLYITHITELKYASLFIGCLSLAVSTVIVLLWTRFQLFSTLPNFLALLPFIRSSVTTRLTQSINYFFLSLISNSFLSTGIEGVLSGFNYIKRISEGIISITFGAHANVYHAKQASAWTTRDQSEFFKNIKQYLFNSMMALIIFILISSLIILYFYSSDFLNEILILKFPLFIILLLWQILMSYETIYVGILLMAKKINIILFVNILFLIFLYFFIQVFREFYEIDFCIGLSIFLSQILVFFCYFYFGLKKIKLNF